MVKGKPTVAIVGRPNVGKSTLFNRLTGRRISITDSQPGVTRDRICANFHWCDKAFFLTDTGGLDFDTRHPVIEQVRRQVELAVAEADLVILLLDAKEGITATDEEISDKLRQSGKQVIEVVNKVDTPEHAWQVISEFFKLGWDDIIPVSGLHGLGINDLLDCIVEKIPETVYDEDREFTGIAVVGRPNVGKSTFINVLLNEERVIVDSKAGTTRDAVDISFNWKKRKFVLIDTAGLRRQGKVKKGIEGYSALRAKQSITRSMLVFLILDLSEGITAQDARIGRYIYDEGKPCILVGNKWDLAFEKAVKSSVDPEKDKGKLTMQLMKQYRESAKAALPFLTFAPLVFVSALNRYNIYKVLELVPGIWEANSKRIPTGPLNSFLEKVLSHYQPPMRGGRRLKIYYITQTAINPPTFVLFVNNPVLVKDSYLRYITNRLRESFGFEGTPIRMITRSRRSG